MHQKKKKKRMHGLTNEPEATCPSNVFEVRGIMRQKVISLSNDFIAPNRRYASIIKNMSYRGDYEIPAGAVKRSSEG